MTHYTSKHAPFHSNVLPWRPRGSPPSIPVAFDGSFRQLLAVVRHLIILDRSRSLKSHLQVWAASLDRAGGLQAGVAAHDLISGETGNR